MTSSTQGTDTASTQLSTKSEGSIAGQQFRGHLEPVELQEAKESTMATTWSEMFKIWPYRTFLIIIMEFCMMLTGLNTVLNLYYINVLKFDTETTTIILSAMAIIGGFTKLIGSIFSDSYLGKFRAIVIGSSIYIVGKLVITGATFMSPGFPHPWLDFTAFAIIMIGTSGMSPCISPFAGDQFQPHQEKMISVFYSVFYGSFNVAAIISCAIMPMLRTRPCLGNDTCYPLSFSVSTTGVICGFIIFILGSKCYTKLPAKGNIFSSVYSVVTVALTNKRSKVNKKRKDHWLDYYFDTHSCEDDLKCLCLRKKEGDDTLCEKHQFVDDLRSLLRLLIMFIPLPVFWALYEQQYTVWVNQALELDGHIYIPLLGDLIIMPDQMQVVNPVIIIVLIFLFQSCIYPIVECVVRLTPLRKMAAGGVFASIAFLVSGLVQLKINPTLPDLPPDQHAFISVINTYDNCTLTINYGPENLSQFKQILPNEALENDKLQGKNEFILVSFGLNYWKVNGVGSDCAENLNEGSKLEFDVSEEMNFIAIGPNGAFLAGAETKKPTGGAGQFKITIVASMEGVYRGNFAFCRNGTECDLKRGEDFYAFPYKERKEVSYKLGNGQHATLYPYKEIRPGNWKLYYLQSELNSNEEKLVVNLVNGVEFSMHQQGGVYAMVLTGSMDAPKANVFQIVPPNSVSILWQLPQIIIISIAEILVSITGLEFAYSQSGQSMKAVASAFWILTSSVGNLLIIFITLLPIRDLAIKAFLCSGAMLVDAIIFALLAIFCYTYRTNPSMVERNEEDQLKGVTKSSRRSSVGSGSIRQVFANISYIHEGGADNTN